MQKLLRVHTQAWFWACNETAGCRVTRELWPHQLRGLAQLRERMKPGARICLACPTGGGKTVMMTELLKEDRRAVLYTNRKMLLDQTSRVLDDNGIRHGVRAAGYATDFTKEIQLASIQTEDARTLKRRSWDLHEADVVLIDEAHVNKEATVNELVTRHLDDGACVVGFTATPLNIGHMYDELIVAGVTSELRECGALVPAHHFAPDEPDCAKIKRTKTGEFTYGDIVKAIMTHSIVGRVIDSWRKLNPEGKPTLLFAPGVKESLWFAEQLVEAGIPAAHIDGDTIWTNGSLYESDRFAREELKKLLQNGEVEIVCNRFVLREGIDWPFVQHMIFATIFGALTSYIQSGGRGLRASPGKEHVVIQDHGGNWWRHGSLNSDRDWQLDHTDYVVGEMREQRLREKKDVEPILCPKCMAVRAGGAVCKNCGHAQSVKSRMVVQHDGSLREVKGDIFRPRTTYKRPDIRDKWKTYYFRAKNSKNQMTFNQARGLFAYENNWQWPPSGLPLMPTQEADWFRPVKEVPADRLTN